MEWWVKVNMVGNMCDWVRLWLRCVPAVNFFYNGMLPCKMGRLMQFENNLFPEKGGGGRRTLISNNFEDR